MNALQKGLRSVSVVVVEGLPHARVLIGLDVHDAFGIDDRIAIRNAFL